MVAGLGVLPLVGGRGRHAAARGLQHEREEVARDEDLRVALRREARVLGAECAYDAGEAEVQTCGVEGGGDGQTDDLDQEAVLRVWVSGLLSW